MIDFKHENYWEYWIYNAYDFADLYVTPFNSIWMSFYFLGNPPHPLNFPAKDTYNIQANEERKIIEKLF